jgi:hypothetical protein
VIKFYSNINLGSPSNDVLDRIYAAARDLIYIVKIFKKLFLFFCFLFPNFYKMSNIPDYYDILDISSTATQDEIREGKIEERETNTKLLFYFSL